VGHDNGSVLRKVSTVNYLGCSRFREGEMGLSVKIVDFVETRRISVNRNLEA
jgi:hypothetical protein